MEMSSQGAGSRFWARLLFALILILGGIRPAAAQNAVVSGVVVNQVNSPISGATVEITNGPSSGSVSTAANGSYLLSNLEPGTYTLRASATGFSSQNRSVTLGSGDNRTINFTLVSDAPQGGVLEGTVTRSDTRQPLAGALVQLTGGAGTIPQTQTTEEDGTFRFSNLSTGVYRLAVDRDGFFGFARNFTVTQNRVTTARVNLRVRGAELSTLQGVVTSNTGNRVRNVLLRLTGGETSASVRTNANGVYRITRVVPGSYVLDVVTEDFAGQNIPVTIPAGQTVTLNIVLQPLGATNSTIEGFTVDNFGDPVPGARVQVVGGPVTGDFDLSDGTGFYRITSLPAGTYTLRASATGYENDTETVTVAQNQTARQDFTLVVDTSQQAGRISGRVTNQFGTGLENVVVQITAGPEVGLSVATDDEGDYTLSDLTPGTYTVRFTRSGFTTRTVTGVAVTAGNTTDLDVTLTGSGTGNGSLRGTVRDADTNDTLIGVTVRLLEGSSVVDTVMTDSNGFYAFGGVEPGSYSVRFSKSGHATLTRSATVSSGGVTTLNVSLQSEDGGGGGGALQVRVSTSSGLPLQTITVRISGPATQTRNTDSEGQATFTGLPAGSYTVTVNATGMQPATQTVTVANGGTTTTNLILVPDGTAGLISGSVFASGGFPLSAVVTLVRGPVVGVSRNTSSSGAFSFTGLPPGAYTLQVRAPGYRTRFVNVFVRAGTTSAVRVILFR